MSDGPGASYRRLAAHCRRNGKLDHAIAAYRQAIALDPDDLAAHRGLAATLARNGDSDGAARIWLAMAASYGATPELQFRLAAVGRGNLPAMVPKSLVTRLFDAFAERYDSHLVDGLHYRVPRLLFDALASVSPPGPHDILDLGCGTGLCGALFKPMARTLDGVDISSRMIEKARLRNIYDRLLIDDLVNALTAHRAGYDLVLAADVLVYVGDLAPVFQAVKTALRPAGLFAFSVEANPGDGVTLRPTNRFAHSLDYLDRLGRAAGFHMLHAATQTLRLENKEDVPGHIIVLRSE